jgi:nuclear GTP-binding protein
MLAEKKADPGIPNSYPYKDKVLAELAEEKRLVGLVRTRNSTRSMLTSSGRRSEACSP